MKTRDPKYDSIVASQSRALIACELAQALRHARYEYLAGDALSNCTIASHMIESLPHGFSPDELNRARILVHHVRRAALYLERFWERQRAEREEALSSAPW